MEDKTDRSQSKKNIPKKIAEEIISEAVRLHTESTDDFSVEEIQQICKEAGISSTAVNKAIVNVQSKQQQKESDDRQRQKAIQEMISNAKDCVQSALPVCIALFGFGIGLIGFIAVYPKVSHFAASLAPKPSPGRQILAEDLQRDAIGKTRQELIQILGQPDDIISDDGAFAWWEYQGIKSIASDRRGSVDVMFNEGVVTSVDYQN